MINIVYSAYLFKGKNQFELEQWLFGHQFEGRFPLIRHLDEKWIFEEGVEILTRDDETGSAALETSLHSD